MALSIHVKVTMLIYSYKTTNFYPLNPLIFTLSRGQKMFRNISTVCSRDQNGFSLLPPFQTTFPRYENILITLCHHQVSHQTMSVKSRSLSLPGGWKFISCQSKLRTNMKIFTYNSKPDIFTFCISSRFGMKSAAHA